MKLVDCKELVVVECSFSNRLSCTKVCGCGYNFLNYVNNDTAFDQMKMTVVN